MKLCIYCVYVVYSSCKEPLHSWLSPESTAQLELRIEQLPEEKPTMTPPTTDELCGVCEFVVTDSKLVVKLWFRPYHVPKGKSLDQWLNTPKWTPLVPRVTWRHQQARDKLSAWRSKCEPMDSEPDHVEPYRDSVSPVSITVLATTTYWPPFFACY